MLVTKGICVDCNEEGMNAICLTCASVHCFLKKHADEHYTTSKHPIVYDTKKAAFWCNECKSIIESVTLNPIAKLLGVPLAMDYSIETVVDKIKAGSIKKIAVMTGAGLSVAAGIPDFRSPSSGLYNTLKEYNLPYPEAVFTIGYFMKKPEVFYKVVQSMAKKYYPTKGHYFIRLLQDKGLLLKNFTQNIDGLEMDAGVKKELLLQAHGTITSSHCIGCRAEVSQELMGEHIISGKPLYCKDCHSPCKPDVVLFGESLPHDFFSQMNQMASADLVIVIGTTLEVTPFADIIQLAGSKVPRIIIDKVTPRKIAAENNKRNVVLLGDAETTIEKLVDMLGYRTEFELLMKEKEGLIKKYEEDKAKGIAKLF